MDNIKVYYETLNDNITVFLEVMRDLGEMWKEPEIGLRGLLSDKLKKIYFGKEEDRHIEGQVEGSSRQYHLYKGLKETLKAIMDYCKISNISVKEGFDDYLKKLILPQP